jgi:hypothetical protein
MAGVRGCQGLGPHPVGQRRLRLAQGKAQAGGSVDLFIDEAREEMALICRTLLQVQRIAWEAPKQGFEEGEKPISRETILNAVGLGL